MIRLLLFEFENTLVDSRGQVFPFVVDALKTMKNFETRTGNELDMCLVSGQVPGDMESGNAFEHLLRRLQTAGLRSFFEPVSQRVITPPNASVDGIDQQFLQIAISQSGTRAGPEQSVFFAGDRNAADAAKCLGIRTLLFDSSGASGADFVNWSEAALLVAKLLDSSSLTNAEAALRLHLAARANMDLLCLTGSPDSNTLLGKVNTWHPIHSEKLGELSGVNVKLPAEVSVQLDASGKVRGVDCTTPSPADEEEAKHFVESLVSHGQIAPESELPSRGASHQINTDSTGRRYLIRKRFTAV